MYICIRYISIYKWVCRRSTMAQVFDCYEQMFADDDNTAVNR